MSEADGTSGVRGGVSRTDPSPVTDDWRQVALLEHDATKDELESVVKKLAATNEEIRETRLLFRNLLQKVYKQFRDNEIASDLMKENAELFGEIQRLLLSGEESLVSAEEQEAFEKQKRFLEEAIESYQNRTASLETQHAAQLEAMKKKHAEDKQELCECKRALELRIEASQRDIEQQKARLKSEHESVLEKLAQDFKTRLAEIKNMKNHQVCEAQLASLQSSWSTTLQGLEVAIERTKDEISDLRRKRKQRQPSSATKRHRKRKSKRTNDDVHPIVEDCSVLLDTFEEVPDSDSADHVTQAKSADTALVSDSAVAGSECLTDATGQVSSSTSAELTTVKKRLFCQEPIEGTLGVITEPAQITVEAYLRSLQKIISANVKSTNTEKRKGAP